MYYVYAIKSKKDRRIYVGMTNDVDTRIREHNAGKVHSTSPYRPWVLFHFEEAQTRLCARIREKELKSGAGKEFLKTLLLNAPVAQTDRAPAF